MKIIFLGTNGWYSSPTGDTPCILIDSKDHYVILDAGNGIYKLDKYINENKPISMFISHFHLDHRSGLHTLAKFNFTQGIDVYVGKGRSKDFQTLVNPPYTIGYLPQPKNIDNLRTEIRLHELGDTAENIPFKASAIRLNHGYGDHGYRVELEDKIVAYTGDSGPADSLNKLCEKVDLLISECSIKEIYQPEWGHLLPTQAATLAKENNVKQLILTHFGPLKYPTLEDRKWAEAKAKEIFPNTTAATDGLEITI